jgi:uncharacterized protein (DUF58 family)
MNARRRWRTRVGAWARRRQGEDVPPLALGWRRLYILPTRAGLAWALLLFVMLLAGLNYNNSLGLILTFQLAGVALVIMFDCHRTLHGLEIVAAEADDAFAGTAAELRLSVANTSRFPRRGLALVPAADTSAWGKARADTLAAPGDGHLDLGTEQAGVLRCRVAARRRGRQAVDALVLSSTQPGGLYRCWTWLHLPLEAIVYPAPQGPAPLPAPRSRRSLTGAAAASGDEEWAALRPFQPGDSPRAVAWKLFARGAPLLVARYEAVRGGEHQFELATTPGKDLEARLSQLAAWILAAESRGEGYGLRIGDVYVPPGLGPAHRRRCLRALALY